MFSHGNSWITSPWKYTFSKLFCFVFLFSALIQIPTTQIAYFQERRNKHYDKFQKKKNTDLYVTNPLSCSCRGPQKQPQPLLFSKFPIIVMSSPMTRIISRQIISRELSERISCNKKNESPVSSFGIEIEVLVVKERPPLAIDEGPAPLLGIRWTHCSCLLLRSHKPWWSGHLLKPQTSKSNPRRSLDSKALFWKLHRSEQICNLVFTLISWASHS